MYGYVIINQSELKFKEFELYRSYYCGFCRKLREKYGFPGQMTLSYDMTFLIMLLCDLYDAEDITGSTRCAAQSSCQPSDTRQRIHRLRGGHESDPLLLLMS